MEKNLHIDPFLKPENVNVFHNGKEACNFIRSYREKLKAIALSQEQRKVMSDQDYPTEMLILKPKKNQGLPLILLGGMGTIAGLEGFEQAHNLCHPLILGTEGLRLGKIYSQPLENSNISYSEPNRILQKMLMDCIYSGVKALNPELACKLGKELLLYLLSNQSNIDCILAGCTEIDYLLKFMKEDGNAEILRLLNSLELINPVSLTLQRTDQALF